MARSKNNVLFQFAVVAVVILIAAVLLAQAPAGQAPAAPQQGAPQGGGGRGGAGGGNRGAGQGAAAPAGRGGAAGGQAAAAPAPSGVTVAGEIKNYVPLTDAMLMNPDPSDWLVLRHDYSASNYSTLNQITAANAGQLQLAWALSMNEGGTQQTAPLVH